MIVAEGGNIQESCTGLRRIGEGSPEQGGGDILGRYERESGTERLAVGVRLMDRAEAEEFRSERTGVRDPSLLASPTVER